MPAFQYTALNASGKQQKGILEGDNEKSIRQQLRDKQLTPLDVSTTNKAGKKQAGKSGKKSAAPKFNQKISNPDLVVLTRQLATLLQAGSPLEEALATAAKQTDKPKVQALVLNLRANVVEGHTFAYALNNHPKVFNELYRSTIEAGEHSGNLDKVLSRLAEYVEAREEINNQLSTALIYPIALVTISLAVIIFLLAYVVPQITQVFDSLEQELPIMTQVMITISDFIRNYWLILLIAFALTYFTIKTLLKNETNRYNWHSILLKTPLIGRLLQGINTARFSRTLGILSASGVSIIKGLEISARVVDMLPMRKAIAESEKLVREGGGISRSLAKSGKFSPMAIHLIASGENNGQLEQMLDRAATFQEREASTTIEKFMSLVQVLLVLGMGVIVMLIVLATLLPIFELNQIVN